MLQVCVRMGPPLVMILMSLLPVMDLHLTRNDLIDRHYSTDDMLLTNTGPLALQGRKQCSAVSECVTRWSRCYMSALAWDKIVPEVSRLIRAMDSDAIVVLARLGFRKG